MTMDGRHPALVRLDALAGRWTVQPKVAGVPAAWTEFEWLEGGPFLRQTTGADPMPPTAPKAWRDNAPSSAVAVIGLDDATGEFTMAYADARGVHRVYRLTFADGVWSIWRDAPGFNQRFTATLSTEGDTMDGRWETSTDGIAWHLDFEVTYTRIH
jgi:hypothetical protein